LNGTLTAGAMPRLYGELAPWFHLVTAPHDYAEEAAAIHGWLGDTADGELRTVLELGSGGGNNASHLRADLELTLTDLSPEMLSVSGDINPGVEHIQGDMRMMRLERTFDGVLLHDAVCYLTTEDDVRAALATAATHCRPGGALVVAPDHTRESFEPGTKHGGHDASDGRAVRYLEWSWDPDPTDTIYSSVMSYVLRAASGEVRHEFDMHVMGLFYRAQWERLLREAGFAATRVVDRWQRDVFLGQRR